MPLFQVLGPPDIGLVSHVPLETFRDSPAAAAADWAIDKADLYKEGAAEVVVTDADGKSWDFSLHWSPGASQPTKMSACLLASGKYAAIACHQHLCEISVEAIEPPESARGVSDVDV